jgi:hypothetical protein
VRERLPNLLYVRAAVEALPAELASLADGVTVVLPWGSLLAAVARPRVDVLRGVRALCRPGAALSVLLGHDPRRDEAELRRLGLPPLDAASLEAALAAGYDDGGFRLHAVRAAPAAEVAALPSTWARQLAHGRDRRFIRLDATAV